MSVLIGGYFTGATAGISCKATFNEVRRLHIALVVVSLWRTTHQPLMTFFDCSADHGLHRSQAIGSWDVGSVTNMDVRRAPPAHHRVARATAAPFAASPRGPAPLRVAVRLTRARRARSKCLAARPPSTSRSARGTSARSQTWGCASPPTARIPYPAAWCPRRSRRCTAPRRRRRRASPNRARRPTSPPPARPPSCVQDMFASATVFNTH